MKKIKEFVIKNFLWIILFSCLIVFFALAKNVFNEEIIHVDIIGYEIISTYLISDTMTPIVKFITNIGGKICLISITIALLLALKNKKISLLICANLIIVTLFNLLIKNILQRPRPTGIKLINESGYSFPSGHSMVGMAFYGYIIYLIYKNIKNKYIKWTFISLLSLFIISIGISRIYLGVHYTSDVIAGFLIAISYLIIYIKITNKLIENNK